MLMGLQAKCKHTDIGEWVRGTVMQTFLKCCEEVTICIVCPQGPLHVTMPTIYPQGPLLGESRLSKWKCGVIKLEGSQGVSLIHYFICLIGL